MADLLALALAALFALLGMGWLALSLEVHWKQTRLRAGALNAATAFTLRLLGGSGLVLSGLMCWLADQPSIAVLVWLMLLAGAAVSIAHVLAWRAHWLRPLLLWHRG